eukprot:6206152-Pleurochrysis_carterae.AAC.1
MACYRSRMDDLEEERKLRREAEAECKTVRGELAKANNQLRVAAGIQTRYEHAQKNLAETGSKNQNLNRELQTAKATIATLQTEVATLKTEVDDAKLMYQTATEQLADGAAEHERALAALRKRADAAESRLADFRHASGVETRGRPRGHAGQAELESRWDVMSSSARRSALCRHSSDIRDALLDAGCEDWLPSCLALALKGIGLMEDLLRTKLVAEHRFELVEEMAELLRSEWN